MDESLLYFASWPLKWAPHNWSLCWRQTVAINGNTPFLNSEYTTLPPYRYRKDWVSLKHRDQDRH